MLEVIHVTYFRCEEVRLNGIYFVVFKTEIGYGWIAVLRCVWAVYPVSHRLKMVVVNVYVSDLNFFLIGTFKAPEYHTERFAMIGFAFVVVYF